MEQFKEVSQNYTLPEAIREAQRCLGCKVPGCKKGCPIGNDIPDWISQLAKGNFGNAIEIIRSRSNLPAVCGRVCAHERQCEGNCALAKSGKHINIGKLERFVADFDSAAGLDHDMIPEKTKGQVAVIGSGPAGLTIAGDLARKGFNVEIFEMEREAGGVLLYGIPEYRLPKEVVRHEIAKISALGVKFHLGVTIGEDMTIDDLFAKGFDAIFIGTGAGLPKKLPIEGMNHPGVKQALRFLRRVQLYNSGHIDRKEVMVGDGDITYVIGGGNTAMDAARTALRLGSKEVTVVYRKTLNEMRALRSEYEDAVKEGVRFMWNSNVVKVNGGEGNRLETLHKGYRCRQQGVCAYPRYAIRHDNTCRSVCRGRCVGTAGYGGSCHARRQACCRGDRTVCLRRQTPRGNIPERGGGIFHTIEPGQSRRVNLIPSRRRIPRLLREGFTI